MEQENHELIVAVVQRGEAEPLMEAAIASGASGATVTYGRGRGVRERLGVLGSLIQPEKEIVLVAVPAEISARVLEAVVREGRLDEPGMGMAMVVPLGSVVGTSIDEGEAG